MTKKPATRKKGITPIAPADYSSLLGGVSELLEAARRASARAVNAFMTAAYWEIGRRIVEFEQHGKKRAEYGKALLEQLSADLTLRYGRGFARPNLIRFVSFISLFRQPQFARQRRTYRHRHIQFVRHCRTNWAMPRLCRQCPHNLPRFRTWLSSPVPSPCPGRTMCC